MITCLKCGKENLEDAKFCNNCGIPLSSEKRREKREEVCFGVDRRGTDYLGLLSFGIFIIIVGGVITLNPNIFSNFLFLARSRRALHLHLSHHKRQIGLY